jgi:hypothetical protein
MWRDSHPTKIPHSGKFIRAFVVLIRSTTAKQHQLKSVSEPAPLPNYAWKVATLEHGSGELM